MAEINELTLWLFNSAQQLIKNESIIDKIVSFEKYYTFYYDYFMMIDDLLKLISYLKYWNY
jgi:hypothetical protein